MKVKRERQAATRAIKDVDVSLPPPPPEGIQPDPSPFRMNRTDKARMALRKRRESSGGGQVGAMLPSMPGVNALSFTIRYLPGGKKRFLEFVRLAALNGDVAATAWWTVYADLTPSERSHVNFDDICEAGGIKPSSLLAGVVGHGMEAMTDMGNLVAAAFHPEVIAAMGKSAVKIESEIGAEDRRLFLQGRGFLPTPKGASIHLHANASANAAAASASHAEPSVPKFAQDMELLSAPALEVQRQISEGTVIADESE